MKKYLITSLLTAIFSITSWGQNNTTFTLKSSTLGGQATSQEVFNGFGCTGENLSPELSWENAPKGTKSFAITMYDPDAPTGSGWWHWIVFNIPKNTTNIPQGAGAIKKELLSKKVIQSITDYGTKGYGGPCPPEGHGLHQYIITVHALNTKKLELNADTNAAIVGYYINNHTIGKASIVSYYQR